MKSKNQQYTLNPILGDSVVKGICLPVQERQETQVWSLGREVPLEKEMATHSSILALKIPWTEEPGRLVYGVAKSWTWLSD